MKLTKNPIDKLKIIVFPESSLTNIGSKIVFSRIFIIGSVDVTKVKNADSMVAVMNKYL